MRHRTRDKTSGARYHGSCIRDLTTHRPRGVAVLDRSEPQDAQAFANEPTVLEFATALVRRRRMISLTALVGAIVMVTWATIASATFTADAVLVSSVSSGGLSGRLGGLASRFGIGGLGTDVSTRPTANPVLISQLATSRVILERIVGDTIAVDGGPPTTIVDLLISDSRSGEGTGVIERRLAIRELARIVVASHDIDSDAVSIVTTSPWPEFSFHVTSRVLEELDRFNQEIGRAEARTERLFAEERLREATDSLTAAEGRLARFLDANRSYENSPQLRFEAQTLQRAVDLKQEIRLSLAQAVEESRLTEVRDTPVLTIVAEPEMPVVRNPRGRVRKALVGFLLGASMAAILVILQYSLEKGRAAGDPRVGAFLDEIRRAVPLRNRA